VLVVAVGLAATSGFRDSSAGAVAKKAGLGDPKSSQLVQSEMAVMIHV